MRAFGPRTIVEAAFLVAVPIIALAAGLRAWSIIGVAAAGYLILIAVEATLARLTAQAFVPQPVSAPEPTPRPKPAAPPKVVPIGKSGAPQRWSLWDLESVARAHAGRDEAVDEERTFLLLYLRDFAGADGLLPLEFDALVRESFGSLVG